MPSPKKLPIRSLFVRGAIAMVPVRDAPMDEEPAMSQGRAVDRVKNVVSMHRVAGSHAEDTSQPKSVAAIIAKAANGVALGPS
jgi:hypothetical protein